MTFISEAWYPHGFDGQAGENITLQPPVLLFSFSPPPPPKLAPEALASGGPKEPSHHPACVAGEPRGTGPAPSQSCSLMATAACII